MKLKTRVPLYLVLALLACTQNAAGQAQTEPAPTAVWTRYTYPGEEFSAELPGMPTVAHSARGVGNNYQRKMEKVRVFSHYADGVIFFVVSYDNPHRSESPDSLANQLYGAWALEAKGPVSAGGFEGRSYDVVGVQRGRLKYDLKGEGRVFRAKRHAYLALAFSNETARPEVERFLNSFTLGEKPSGERVAEPEPVPRFVPPEKSAGPPPGGGTEERLKLVRREGAAPARAPGEPLTGQGTDRRALIVYKPEPGYTEEARQRGVRGTMRLRAVLSPTGVVTNVEPITWLSSGLTEKAIEAARRIRFFPAQKDGRPVAQYVLLEYNFSIY